MNSAQYEEMVSLLNDLASRLDRIEHRVDSLAEHPAELRRGPDAPAPATGLDRSADGPPEGAVADGRDLDGPYGNPEIRRDPPRWTGPSFVGRRFSEASPDFLDALAGFYDWKARESDKRDERVKGGALKSRFIRLDAARARGWRKRILEGAPMPRPMQPGAGRAAPRESMEMDFDGDMPF